VNLLAARDEELVVSGDMSGDASAEVDEFGEAVLLAADATTVLGQRRVSEVAKEAFPVHCACVQLPRRKGLLVIGGGVPCFAFKPLFGETFALTTDDINTTL